MRNHLPIICEKIINFIKTAKKGWNVVIVLSQKKNLSPDSERGINEEKNKR